MKARKSPRMNAYEIKNIVKSFLKIFILHANY